MKFEKISYAQWYKDTNITEELYNEIKIPTRATTGSAGYDFFSPQKIVLKPKQSILVPTGIKINLDSDKCLFMLPRGGHGFKFKVQLWNTVGLVDCDYYNNPKNEGHIMVKLYNDSPDGETLVIEPGQALCQGVILPFYTTIDDYVENKRAGGFGSTDKEV